MANHKLPKCDYITANVASYDLPYLAVIKLPNIPFMTVTNIAFLKWQVNFCRFWKLLVIYSLEAAGVSVTYNRYYDVH